MTTSVTLSDQLPRRTFGSSASRGSVVMESTAVCTSVAARDMSQPGWNSTVMTPKFSRLEADVLSTPSIASISGSSTWMIAASISSAPAPRHSTETVTFAITTSGKNCARMFGTAARPSTTITSSSRFAAVGWRVK